jgi:hypothetical protein|tara:strand:+ start:4247 stop:4519 length:273 start_codon:yes stop_codon:yes gene_type:complete
MQREVKMGLETKTIEAIKQKWQESDIGVPSAYWQYGTLWVDHPPAGGVEAVKEAMLEVLNPGLDVQVSKLKATTTEPWDQYAFDIVGEVK